MMQIIEGDLSDPHVVELVQIHHAKSVAESPPGSSHTLDLSDLRSPDIRFWAMWNAAALVGLGALKELSVDHGEIKSMHVVEAKRGRGAGSVMLRHIIGEARARGMSRLSLETGALPYFAAARALYQNHGFVECAPFGDYKPDPASVFMTLDLRA